MGVETRRKSKEYESEASGSSSEASETRARKPKQPKKSRKARKRSSSARARKGRGRRREEIRKRRRTKNRDIDADRTAKSSKKNASSRIDKTEQRSKGKTKRKAQAENSSNSESSEEVSEASRDDDGSWEPKKDDDNIATRNKNRRRRATTTKCVEVSDEEVKPPVRRKRARGGDDEEMSAPAKKKKPLAKEKAKGNSRKPRPRSARNYSDEEWTSKKKSKRRRERRPMAFNQNDESSSSTDTIMEKRRASQLARDRGRIRPVNQEACALYDPDMAPDMKGGKKKKNAKSADISPMKIDLNVDWKSIGGLEGHIQKLKEMVVLPMLYPKEFEKFKMTPPKGVLFHGPPGTGKTLVARVLAAQCSRPGKKVAFYMRKGADCLSKWVGEAERQLRLLFDEAHKNQPSVIFFDEIDGLAPVRSSRQDQIHSSIVSTLLALMDGLDGRGQIIVIGATNRIDAIDPALRRPGRFDRELCFTLPSRAARRQILQIKTKSWDPPLPAELLDRVADKCVGYCGADLEALCRESFLNSVRRTYPQIYDSDVKLLIDPNKLCVEIRDFESAMMEVVPASQRSSVVYARTLPPLLQPLLKGQLENVRKEQLKLFPLSCSTKAQKMNLEDSSNEPAPDIGTVDAVEEKQEIEFERMDLKPCRPRMLIHGSSIGWGQRHIGTAVLHYLEEYPVYSLDLPSMHGDQCARNCEEVCLRKFKEARKNAPSVVYWPHLDRWWEAATLSLKLCISTLISDLPETAPVFLLATSNCHVNELDDMLQQIFHENTTRYKMTAPPSEVIREFWKSLERDCISPPRRKVRKKDYPKLPVAPVEDDLKGDAAKAASEKKNDDSTMHNQQEQDFRNLRTGIRNTCSRLIKHFGKDFAKEWDVDGVVQNDMGLLKIRQRNNDRKFPTVQAFLDDIDKLVENVRTSHNPEVIKAREFVNEACHLQDQCLALVCQLPREVVERCNRAAMQLSKETKDQETKEGKESESSKNAKADEPEPATNEDAMDIQEDIAEPKEEVPAPIPPAPTSNAPSNDKEMSETTESSAMSKDSIVREVSICRDRLSKLMDDATKQCAGYTVDELEDVYFRLLNVVYRFSSLWDRTGMLDELQKEITKLKRI